MSLKKVIVLIFTILYFTPQIFIVTSIPLSINIQGIVRPQIIARNGILAPKSHAVNRHLGFGKSASAFLPKANNSVKTPPQKWATKSDKNLAQQSIAVAPLDEVNDGSELSHNWHPFESSLGEYIQQILDYYNRQPHPDETLGVMPAKTIANVLNAVAQALKAQLYEHEFVSFPGEIQPLFYHDARQRDELPKLLRFEDFWVEHFSSADDADGNVTIKYFKEKGQKSGNGEKMGKIEIQDLFLMSPEQIKEMRQNTDKSDIVWFFGTLIHLMLYQVFPLDELVDVEELNAKYTLLGNFGEAQAFEKEFTADIQEQIGKFLAENKAIPFRAAVPTEQHEPMVALMKACLQMSKNRISFDEFEAKVRNVLDANYPNSSNRIPRALFSTT